MNVHTTLGLLRRIGDTPVNRAALRRKNVEEMCAEWEEQRAPHYSVPFEVILNAVLQPFMFAAVKSAGERAARAAAKR